MNKTIMELIAKVNESQSATTGALNILTSKVDSIEEKVNRIVEAIEKKNGTSTIPKAVEVVKCAHCGIEIKSQKVIDYCKSRRMGGVFCPTCQAKKGLASSKLKIKEPRPAGFKATCVYCGRTFKWFATQEARREYLDKCLERGYKGLTCACCVNTESKELAVPEGRTESMQDTQDRIDSAKYNTTNIEAERNADRIKANTLHTPEELTTFLLSLNYSEEQIKKMRITSINKVCKEHGKICNVTKEDWSEAKKAKLANKSEMTFSVLPEESQEEGEQQSF